MRSSCGRLLARALSLSVRDLKPTLLVFIIYFVFGRENRLTNRLLFQLMVVGLRRGCRYIVTGRKLCNLNSPNISSTDYSAAPASAAVLYAQIANPTQDRAAARRSRPAWRINSPRRPPPTAPVGIHAATRHSVTAGCIIQRTSNATLVWNVVSYLGLPATSQGFERYHTVESF